MHDCCWMSVVVFLMIPRPPRSTRTDTLFPDTTLFRSKKQGSARTCLCSHAFAMISGPMPAGSPRDIAKGAMLILSIPVFNYSQLQRPAEGPADRSEAHTSELQSLMRTSYAVFFFKTKKIYLDSTQAIYTHKYYTN